MLELEYRDHISMSIAVDLNPSSFTASDSGDSTLKQEQEQAIQGNTTSVPWNIKPKTAVNFGVILMTPGVNSSVRDREAAILFYRELSIYLIYQNNTEGSKPAQFSISSGCSDFTGVFWQIYIDTDLWELIQLVLV